MLIIEARAALTLLKVRRGIKSSSERGLPSWFMKLLTDVIVINMPMNMGDRKPDYILFVKYIIVIFNRFFILFEVKIY